MEKYLQMAFRSNVKDYNRLKENSYYIKDLNRGIIDYKNFVEKMKLKYKERVTDKISNVMDNMEIINSVLSVLK